MAIRRPAGEPEYSPFEAKEARIKRAIDSAIAEGEITVRIGADLVRRTFEAAAAHTPAIPVHRWLATAVSAQLAKEGK